MPRRVIFQLGGSRSGGLCCGRRCLLPQRQGPASLIWWTASIAVIVLHLGANRLHLGARATPRLSRRCLQGSTPRWPRSAFTVVGRGEGRGPLGCPMLPNPSASSHASHHTYKYEKDDGTAAVDSVPSICRVAIVAVVSCSKLGRISCLPTHAGLPPSLPVPLHCTVLPGFDGGRGVWCQPRQVSFTSISRGRKEFPRVHYRVARTIDASTLTTLRDLVPTKLAAGVWNCLARFKAMIPEFPQTETCELLIVDRSIDQVPSKSGSGIENKEVLLEDHDPIWLELWHVHIASASERLHEKMTNFVSNNKAAQLHQARNGGDLSTKELQKMVQALPQYSDQIDKLALNVEIAGKLNSTIKEQQLEDIGQLEQDLVFGDAGTKELINFFRTHLDISRENKLRLFMIYAAINPDKTRNDKGTKFMQLAGLSADDMIAVSNMHCLCGHDSKRSLAGGFTLKFDLRKKKHGIRKERIREESKWMLSRFYPILEELIEKLSKGDLPKDEYHCLNDPSPSFLPEQARLISQLNP